MSCKHKFQPRYNRKWSTALKDLLDAGLSLTSLGGHAKPYLAEETYVCDVCTKCGATVNLDVKEAEHD